MAIKHSLNLKTKKPLPPKSLTHERLRSQHHHHLFYAQKAQAQKLAALRFEQLITFLQNQLSQQRTFGARMAEETLLKREDIRSLLDQELDQQARDVQDVKSEPNPGGTV